MALSKQKNSPNWYVRLQVAGRRIERSTGTSDYQEAKRIHAVIEEKLRSKLPYARRPDYTFGDAAKMWVKKALRDQNKTLEKNLKMLDLIKPHLAHIKLSDLNKMHIETFIEARSTYRRRKKVNGEWVYRDCKSSNASINRYLELVRHICRLAKNEWQMTDNMPPIHMLPENKEKWRWLTPEEAKKLLSKLPPHLKDMAAFALQTGLRESNITGLEWDRVDLVKGHAWIPGYQSKSGKPIPVPLNKTAIRIIRKQLGNHAQYVFVYKKHRVTKCNNTAWKRARIEAGLPNLRFHDLRHTWASWHVQNGTSLHELQQLGGWANYEMVLRYAHLSGDHLKDAAEKISGVNLGYGQPELSLVATK